MILWDYLHSVLLEYRESPWCVVGEMNVVHKSDKRLAGNLTWYDGDDALDSLMRYAELEDLGISGAFCTWQDKRWNTILWKLDKAVINLK